MSVVVQQVDAAAVVPLRQEVLRPGRPEGESHYEADDLPDTVHLAAVDDDGQVLGCATFFPEPYQGRAAWRLRGMATPAAARGHGHGSALMRAGLALLRQRGVQLLWCNARVSALGFYRPFGFVTVGDEFCIVGIPHYVAVLDLTGTANGTST